MGLVHETVLNHLKVALCCLRSSKYRVSRSDMDEGSGLRVHVRRLIAPKAKCVFLQQGLRCQTTHRFHSRTITEVAKDRRGRFE